MRISVRKADPGYHVNVYGRYTVTVDGVDVTNICVTADEGLGEAWCHLCGRDGKRLKSRDRVLEVCAYGNVVIRLKDPT